MATYKDETDNRTDGTIRKAHYGEGEQPWDTAVRRGWAAEFAATNVLKYLRRTGKDPEHSLESAKRYYEWLVKLAIKGVKNAAIASLVLGELHEELTADEKKTLNI